MPLRFLATRLLAVALLLSPVACSPKQDPVPATSWGQGYYRLDGRNHNGVAQAIEQSVAASASQPAHEALILRITTDNSPDQEYFQLEFTKPIGQAPTAYTLTTLTYFPTGAGSGTLYSDDGTTLLAASNGSYSGTFSGKNTTTTASGTVVTHTITNGVFTGVHP